MSTEQAVQVDSDKLTRFVFRAVDLNVMYEARP
jgi:hypothetical protein